MFEKYHFLNMNMDLSKLLKEIGILLYHKSI